MKKIEHIQNEVLVIYTIQFTKLTILEHLRVLILYWCTTK